MDDLCYAGTWWLLAIRNVTGITFCLGVVFYSLIICSMSRNGCCSTKVSPGGGESLGALWQAFSKPHPQASRCWVDNWWETNRQAGSWGPAPCQPQTMEKPTQQKKGHQIHQLHLLCRREQHQRFTRLTSVFAWAAAWTFWFFLPLRQKPAPFFFSPPCGWTMGFFSFPWFSGFFGSSVGVSGRTIQYLASMFLAFSLCHADILFIKKRLRIFCFHPLLLISYWQKVIVGTLFLEETLVPERFLLNFMSYLRVKWPLNSSLIFHTGAGKV